MITGFLVRPDLTHNIVEFELDSAAQFLGGLGQDRVAVAFQEDGTDYAALFNPEAKANGAEPNPVASLGRNAAATGDAAFFSDPTAAICGTVIFVGAEVSMTSVASRTASVRCGPTARTSRRSTSCGARPSSTWVSSGSTDPATTRRRPFGSREG